MNQLKKKKLCWNCEGSVDRDAENCLYCGVYLHPEDKKKQQEELEEEDFEPPYQEEEVVEEKTTPAPSYVAEAIAEPKITQQNIKAALIPILFLLSGSFFFFFGMILYLFSTDGVFVLRWNAHYWFVYLFLSAPLLFGGWRALRYLDDE